MEISLTDHRIIYHRDWAMWVYTSNGSRTNGETLKESLLVLECSSS